MAANSHIRVGVLGALALTAATIVALPVAKAIDAVTLTPAPQVKVNRAAKGDLLAVRRTVPKQTPEQAIRKPSGPNQKQRIMDGCDPLFSPVTTPSMAHIPGRCVG
ncbi:MAG: hypothetical protein K2Z80_27345 [Xanthobacteraceae bacterium]|nr:hypothetical protein [Xanthobacteraceae bacterium]MBX9845529.1 hypothetical protein [Xanthobacteraceae bacterium]